MNPFLIFLIYSVIGWFLDTAYRSLYDHELSIGSYFKAPIAPIYGFGALLIFFLHPYVAQAPLLLEGLLFGIMIAAMEYVGGVYCVRVLRKKMWWYKGKWTIGGHTHANRILFYGVLALMTVYIVHPFIVARLP